MLKKLKQISVNFHTIFEPSVSLVQLADFIYRAGYVTEAFHVLRDALDINQLEPAIYLAMGNALQAANNYTGAVEFYNFAMYLKPTYSAF